MHALCALLLAATVTVPPPVMSPETREKREQELAAARADYEKNPDDPDAIIWLGRRTAYLGDYAGAIEIFSEGTKKHPRDARMLRHRGHRHITLRQLDKAIEDLEAAAALIRGQEDQVEPDGLPNDRNIPTSTLQSNIWYHLGLAHYLAGNFEKALIAYNECMKVSKNPDGIVSTSYWLYSTLRRLGRPEEAERVLVGIGSDLEVIENRSYLELLLMARGEIDPAELASANPATVEGATILYGVANWYLYNGQPERAKPILTRIIEGPQWAAFGFIAAEAERE
jgi:tetratricopeptide (TPR) repeat protein